MIAIYTLPVFIVVLILALRFVRSKNNSTRSRAIVAGVFLFALTAPFVAAVSQVISFLLVAGLGLGLLMRRHWDEATGKEKK
ncbi:MAG: hypothetical protein ABI639_08400 [Thermoanaerobaculia bacterium]